MSDIEIFEALRSRSSIQVARRLLAGNGFPKGTGWEQVLEKLNDEEAAANADYDGLRQDLRRLLASYDKSCQVYRLAPADAHELRDAVAKLVIDQSNPFVTSFPLPIPPAVLATMPEQEPTPVSKFQTAELHGILLSSIKTVETRDRLNSAQVNPTSVVDYDEYIGIKKTKVQSFDAVIVSKKLNFAYVLVDAFKLTTDAVISTVHIELRKFVNSKVGRKILVDPVNLWPVINPLYKGQEGSVRTLLWTTTTSSAKHEWMRGGGACLRQEIAHKAAMGALGTGFTTYGIEVRWELDAVHDYTPRPQLSILGTYRMAYELSPKLTDATIRGCANLSELKGMLEQVMLHINGAKAI